MPLIGLGLANIGTSGKILDVFYPIIAFKDGDQESSNLYESWNQLMESGVMEIQNPDALHLKDEAILSSLNVLGSNVRLILCRLLEDEKVSNVEEAYLKLHLLSYKFFQPNTLNLENLFNTLPNVAWTNAGPVELKDIHLAILESKKTCSSLEITSIDKFPRLTDYIVPPGVRIADTSRVRLGAYLSEGTTVMHEGFVNFNAGTLGAAMIEGRISAGVIVGKNSDLGGGSSTMGTLSGGNHVKISVGENSLLGANAGLGIPLGNNCIVEAGLYLTGSCKVEVFDKNMKSQGIVKAEQLSNKDNLLFIRNSLSGGIEARVNIKSIELNDVLHHNQ